MKSEWFRRHPTVRDRAHYERIFVEATAPIEARLAAKGVYAARYGEYGDQADDDALCEITRRLLLRYGETLTAEEAMAEMAGDHSL